MLSLSSSSEEEDEEEEEEEEEELTWGVILCGCVCGMCGK